MEEYQKTFVQAIEALKAIKDEVGGMRLAFHDSLRQTMCDVLGV